LLGEGDGDAEGRHTATGSVNSSSCTNVSNKEASFNLVSWWRDGEGDDGNKKAWVVMKVEVLRAHNREMMAA